LIIVAVGHQKNVGKDLFVKFCVDYLRQTNEYTRKKIVRRGFADKLYDFCQSTYGWAGFKSRMHYMQHPEDKEHTLHQLGKTPREILIDIGNHLRQYDAEIWMNSCVRDNTCDLLFVPDCRYPNELKLCEAEGAILVKITRPNLPTPTDVADTALNDYDPFWHHTLVNDGDLNNLRMMAETFCLHNIIKRK
jgi:hypothetical protein